MINEIKQYMVKNNTESITYEEYMNIVLYHPEKGYYMRTGEKVGKKGDFITSSNISDVFGKLFAKVFIQTIESGRLPPSICEVGGGNGRFAKAVLDEIKEKSPKIYNELKYLLVETSPYHRILQENVLAVHPNVIQLENISEMEERYEGIIFSNELFDAFPVRVIEKQGTELMEVFISVNEKDELTERFLPLQCERINSYLLEQRIVLKDGQRFEIPLAMIEFLQLISKKISKAVLFTVDYGYTNSEWEDATHKEGSLRGYYKHQLIKNPLLYPGEMDLTTHIHFDALQHYGAAVGLQFVQKYRQDEFLLGSGILEYLQENFDPNPFSDKSKQNRAIRSLIMDGGMSQAFHVIIQQKGCRINVETLIKEK
ncbi:SAM-dependent methyltransferase [Bacillus timonensis]|nr:SAM-dependent methyltransferase [Bacillus timonensis]